MLGEVPVRPQLVVLLYRSQHVSVGHLVPTWVMRHLVLQDRYGLSFLPAAYQGRGPRARRLSRRRPTSVCFH
jgi:hypothetical protein